MREKCCHKSRPGRDCHQQLQGDDQVSHYRKPHLLLSSLATTENLQTQTEILPSNTNTKSHDNQRENC